MKVRWLIPLLLSGSSAVADAVHVVGTAAPLPGSTIVSVEGGRVVYTDLTGKRRQRGIEEIQSLSFDRHSAIDLAEARLAAGNAEDGVRLLLIAMLDAPDESTRRWTLRRLVQVHDGRGEYPQAVAHLARLLADDSHPAWLRILPMTAPGVSTPAAAAEALREVRRARTQSEDGDVLAAIRKLEASLLELDREEISGSVSGFDVEAIRNPDAVPASPSAVPSAPDGPASDSNDINRLLAAGDYEAALEACSRAAEAGDRRSMARLLWQTGEANRGLGLDEEAIIAYTRSGLLFPDAATAAPSLAGAAALAARIWPERPDSVHLWEEALRIARRAGDGEVEARARAALKDSNDQGGSRP